MTPPFVQGPVLSDSDIDPQTTLILTPLRGDRMELEPTCYFQQRRHQ
jgi:hypothetical protein